MKKYFIISLLLFCFILQNLDAKETRLLRYPHISGNLITFSYGGDIYTVEKSGGLARRITTSEGNGINDPSMAINMKIVR